MTTALTTPALPSVETIRSRFPALERRHNGAPVAYFDGPGGTQVPQSVVDAMSDYLLRHNANTHWAYPTSIETDALIEAARVTVADFLGGRPSEIAFGANMTTLTFHLGRALGRRWSRGDEIVVTELDHHANVDPWRQLANERGLAVKAVPFRRQTGQLEMDALASALGPRTRLVAIGAASNALGTINDVRRVADLAHAAGALVFVDAVHYAPHALVDVTALGADFLACSAYKFYGPHVGVLWARQALVEVLDLPKLGPAPDGSPENLETGTQNHEGIVGAAAAVVFLASLAEGSSRRARLEGAFKAWAGARRAPLVRTAGARRGDGVRSATERAADADRLIRRARRPFRRRRACPRRAGRLRLERRLLRDDRRGAPRSRHGRRRARRMRLLHDGGRGRSPARRRSHGVESLGRTKVKKPARVAGSLAFVLAFAAPASPQAAATPQEMRHRHDDPMAYIASLDDPKRDAYQKPDEVMKALALREGEVVADIGAGSGYFALRFARAVGNRGRVYAVDISPDMVRHLNRRLRDARVRNVFTVLSDPDDPLLLDSSVDRFVIVDTWHHVEDQAKYLALMKRMLKPGGQVVHIDFQKRELPIGPPLGMKIARDDLVKQMQGAGFWLAAEHTFLPYQYFLVFTLASIPTAGSRPNRTGH